MTHTEKKRYSNAVPCRHSIEGGNRSRASQLRTPSEVSTTTSGLLPSGKGKNYRINDEIQIAKSLHHPRIVSFVRAWVNKKDEEVIFITERVSGGSLRAYTQRLAAPLKLKLIRNWSRQILEGLEMLANEVTATGKAVKPTTRQTETFDLLMNGYVKSLEEEIAQILQIEEIKICSQAPATILPEAAALAHKNTEVFATSMYFVTTAHHLRELQRAANILRNHGVTKNMLFFVQQINTLDAKLPGSTGGGNDP